jgi:hypothetical protein
MVRAVPENRWTRPGPMFGQKKYGKNSFCPEKRCELITRLPGNYPDTGWTIDSSIFSRREISDSSGFSQKNRIARAGKFFSAQKRFRNYFFAREKYLIADLATPLRIRYNPPKIRQELPGF